MLRDMSKSRIHHSLKHEQITLSSLPQSMSKSRTHHSLKASKRWRDAEASTLAVSPAAAEFVTERTHICLSMSACRNRQFVPSQLKNAPRTQAKHEHPYATQVDHLTWSSSSTQYPHHYKAILGCTLCSRGHCAHDSLDKAPARHEVYGRNMQRALIMRFVAGGL